MKTTHLISGILLSTVLLMSCKGNEVPPAEENMDANHPQEIDSRNRDTLDTLNTIQDTLEGPKM